MKKILINTFLVLFFLVNVSSCGKKGPLQQIPDKSPVKINDLKIFQKGAYIYLEWKFPELLSDEKNPMELSLIRSISVYSGTDSFNGSNFKRKSQSDFRLKFKELHSDNGTYSVKILKKPVHLKDQKHYFGLFYKYKFKKSILSNIVSLNTFVPARQITNFKLTKENKVIILTWDKPKTDIEGNPLKTASGYNIYRSISKKPEQKPEFILLNKPNSQTTETFNDKETTNEGKYSYYVSTTHSKDVESISSKIVSCQVKNIYATAAPQNLVCIRDKKGLYLTWGRVDEQDLAFYRIYRKKENEFEFKILIKNTKENIFVDTSVTKGTKYFYQVTALDNAGNESAPSNTAREKF